MAEDGGQNGGGHSGAAGRVTIRTVAADAGVSVAAVSKVLRNAYGVSDALRGRVMASITRLGYRPSTAARGMRGQTYTIGILLVEMTNPFIFQVIEGINAVLEPSLYKSMFAVGHSATNLESSLIESMIDTRMDGIILIAPRMAGETLARFAQQIPMVAVGHHEGSATGFDTVNSDDFAGARMATEALMARGYDRVWMISQDDEDHRREEVTYQREQGYAAALAAAGRDGHILRLPFNGHDRSLHFQAFLNAPNRPSAVFVWSDLDAVVLINMAKSQGIRVPEDLAIIGYDNNFIAALPLIDLASIDQHGPHIGRLAIEALLSRIAGRNEPLHHLIAPRVVPRSSI